MKNLYTKVIVGTLLSSVLLTASAAFAQGTSTAYPMMKPAPKTVDLTCAAAAVATREMAISTAFATKSSAISAAFTTRASALAAAWMITTAKDRNAAIKAAWKTFNTSARAARKDYMMANSAAWKTFRTSAKACHASTSVEAAGGGVDANL